MFDFLPSPEPNDSDPATNDQRVETVEASALTIPAAESPAIVSTVAEEPPAETESPADPAFNDGEASADADEADPLDSATEKKASSAVSKAATGEKDLVDQVDLPDFSHEPTEPGRYTLRIVFTFRPGDQSVLLSTKSHDVLAIVGELDPEGARALLAPFIAAHDARLSEIKQALAKPVAKVPPRITGGRSTGARSNAARVAATKKGSPVPSTSTKTSAARKDKAPKVIKPASPAPLPQTNLFND